MMNQNYPYYNNQTGSMGYGMRGFGNTNMNQQFGNQQFGTMPNQFRSNLNIDYNQMP
jgi:hypothetical protein